MGKSNRKLQKELKKQVPVKKTNDNEHTMNVVMISVAIAVSLAIIVLAAILIFGGVKDKNAKPDEIVAVDSDNYEIDNAMLSYFYTTNFYNFYQQNYMALYQYGFDPTKPLSSQIYDQSQGTTWHQYFLNLAANNIVQLVALAEAADDAGFKLDEEDIKNIDQTIADTEADAKEKGKTIEEYVEYLYGEGVTVDTVRKALELSVLANKQTEALTESFNITTEDCEAYYQENKNTFDKASFRIFDVSANVTVDMTEEEKQAAYNEAEATAEKIAASASEEEFVEKVYEYLLDNNAANGNALGEEQILKNAQDSLAKDYTYAEGGKVDVWAFDSARKVGDHTVIATSEGTFTAVYMASLPAREEYNLKTVRHILISTSDTELKEAEAKRDELQAAWDASDKTEEAFEKLAEKYNEDSSSLYENITKGQMVEQFENWCFDEARKPGDCEMVTTEYGYHLIYFVESGLPAWENTAKEAINMNKLSEAIDGLVKKYNVNLDVSKAGRVKDYNAYQVVEDTTAAEAADTAIDTAVDTAADTAVDTAVDTALDTAVDTAA